MKTDEVRDIYLGFFKKKGHTLVSSDSLVPTNDPSLLFTGAGMNQFKENFLGLKKDLKRATSCQKCIRTGDLDEVGKTPYHHSFFEMLGNFSFGDYFKEEAIQWAWEFVTKTMKMAPNRLRISVHNNDHEAYRIWKDKIKLANKSIVKFGDHDNFWPADAPKMGPNGPCGPCSEIYYQQEDGSFTEIWNLVFTQFDRQEGGRLIDLPQKNIDTGMGLERLVAVIQNKKSNFDIDTFVTLREKVKTILENNAYAQQDMIKINSICDHMRAAAFAVLDGAYPTNDGRGYVVRKLIRRSVWMSYQLGLKKTRLFELTRTIADVMKKPYPELIENVHSVEQTLKSEEDRFRSTLDEGVERTSTIIDQCISHRKDTLDAHEVFKLYDTFGFPTELTRELALAKNIKIDEVGFNQLLNEQRERARLDTKLSADIFNVSELDRIISELKPTEFRGYEDDRCQSSVIYFAPLASSKTQGVLILDKTVCYAEGGGQVGDEGEILVNGQCIAKVKDTTKNNEIYVHQLHDITSGASLQKGDIVTVRLLSSVRANTMKNHTATHLLHAALRAVLGEHVRQAGSLVHPSRLRFDFTHHKALSPDEIKQIEDLVNGQIKKKVPVQKVVKNLNDAKKEGAIAFFGEKYGDKVRTITIGGFSKELCGGTHVQNTADIGAFKIISESSVASGTRRIEALTGDAVAKWEEQQTQLQEKKEEAEKVKKMRKQAQQQEIAQLTGSKNIDQLLKEAEEYQTNKLIVKNFESADASVLRAIYDALKTKAVDGIYVALSTDANKLNVLVGLLGSCLNKESVSAGQILKRMGEVLPIRGGGKKHLAQAGGKFEGNLDAKVKPVIELIKKELDQ